MYIVFLFATCLVALRHGFVMFLVTSCNDAPAAALRICLQIVKCTINLLIDFQPALFLVHYHLLINL
jgi:hypothetical protein